MVHDGQPAPRRPPPQLDHRRPARQPGAPSGSACRPRRPRPTSPRPPSRSSPRRWTQLARTGRDDRRGRPGHRARRRRLVPRPGRSTSTSRRPPRRRPGRGRRAVAGCSPPPATRSPSRCARPCRPAGLGAGVLVCLPARCAEDELELALAGAQAATAAAPGTRFVLVQHGTGRGRAGQDAAAGGARSCGPPSCTARRPVPEAVDRVDRPRSAATDGFAEVHYDAAGRRRVPTLRALPVRPARAERRRSAPTTCCWSPAAARASPPSAPWPWPCDSGAAPGRCSAAPTPPRTPSWPPTSSGWPTPASRVRYARADVTDAGAGAAGRRRARRRAGPGHRGAARRRAATSRRALASLDHGRLPRAPSRRRSTACAPCSTRSTRTRLRLLVTFGSIIGRAGLRGEAHYATANEWLAELTAEFGRAAPGLPQPLPGVVGLVRRRHGRAAVRGRGADPRGHHPDHPRPGRARSCGACWPTRDAPSVVVISGRTEGIDTVRYDRPELPLLRFVERPLVRYHGVELVAEAELTPAPTSTWPTTGSTATCCSPRCSAWRRWPRSPPR